MQAQIPPGTAYLSSLNQLDDLTRTPEEAWSMMPAGQLANLIIGLDALVYALLTRERIYTSGNPKWKSQLWPLHPDIPIEFKIPNPNLRNVDIMLAVEKQMEDTRFARLMYASVDAMEEIIKSDELWPLLNLPEGKMDALRSMKMLRFNRKSMTEFLMVGSALEIIYSMDLGIPFIGTQVEAPMCIYDQLERSKEQSTLPMPTSQLTVDVLKQIWYSSATEANKLRRYNFYTVEMPFFLLAVLRESKRPSDIMNIVLQMRRSKEARGFREWTLNLDIESNPIKFIRQIDEVKGLLSKMAYMTDTKSESATLTVGVSLSGPSMSLSKPVPARDILDKLPWRNRHLRFIKRLFRNAMEVGQFEDEIIRVFCVPSDVTKKALHLIDSTARPDAT